MRRIRVAQLVLIPVGCAIAFVSALAQNTLVASTTTAQGGSASPDLSKTPAAMATMPARPTQPMPRAAASAYPQKPISIDDGLAGITLTDDQKAKIEQVRTASRAHMDLVVNDPKETPDQKQAMIQGLQRMALRQVYMLLTADQRADFRKKVMAQRAADQHQAQAPQTAQPK